MLVLPQAVHSKPGLPGASNTPNQAADSTRLTFYFNKLSPAARDTSSI